MNDQNFIISENIDILVYGSMNFQFIKQIILNSSQIKSQDMKLSTNNEKDQIQKTYQENIHQLVKLNIVDNIDLQKYDSELTDEQSVANFQKIFASISTDKFWITINFHLVNDMLIDPFVNRFVIANINLVVLTTNTQNEQDYLKTIQLFDIFAGDQLKSSIKYQSQMLLLQSGQYQAYNDNIVLALIENPELQTVGPCFIAAYNKNDQVIKNFEKTKFEKHKNYSKIQDMEINPQDATIEFYLWIIQTHFKISYDKQLDGDDLRQIQDFLKQETRDKSSDNKTCKIF